VPRSARMLGPVFLPALLFLCAVPPVLGAMVSSAKISAELALNRELLQAGDGQVIGCRLWNARHRVALFVDLRYAQVDDELLQLDAAPRLLDREVHLTDEGFLRLREALGQGPSPEPPRDGYTVVVDPGHGGTDPGAVGPNGLTEKEVNLGIALALAKRLRDEDVRVILTRAKDVAVDLDRRAEIANRVGCDLFISIHANAVRNRRVEGHMVLIPADEWNERDRGNVADRAMEAASLADLASKGLSGVRLSRRTSATLFGVLLEEYRRRSYLAAQEIGKALARRMKTHNRGSIEDPRGLRVLRKTYCPAVLVEVDFLSNPRVEKRLANARYQNRVAEAIAEGVTAFLKRHNGAGE